MTSFNFKHMYKNQIILIAMVSTFFSGCNPSTDSESLKVIKPTWKVGVSDTRDQEPGEYFDAVVPGSVLLDYMKAKNDPPFYFNDNFTRYHPLEDKFWRYRATFTKPAIPADHNLYFISRGIDYEFEILINNTSIHYQEGMFTPVKLVLDNYLENSNVLEVIIYPIPKESGQPVSSRQARRSVKPPVPYGWDWHPRLVPVGIWDETFLSVRSETQVIQDDLNYTFKDGYSNVDIVYSITTSNSAGKTLRWTLTDAEGNTVVEKKEPVSTVPTELKGQLYHVNVWWPHDQGTPYLYESRLQLLEGSNIFDEVIRKIGFRDIKLVMNEGAWHGPSGFPKSRNVPPFTLQINGRRIFAKGSNWVHPEIFYGIIDRERYREQLILARDANFNILRNWGGGIVNKEDFFELCDSLGLLVWQEFPLACNEYPDDAHYLKVLEQEAISIIRKVKPHPCLAMWSGGNELFNNWSRMTDQSLALRLLNSLCYRMDPGTPFIPTSPIMGVGHGHYIFYDAATDEEVFQVMKRADKTAYTEFGMPGMASVEVLKTIIPEEEWFPPQPNTAWEIHHGFGAWQKNSWLELPTLEKYFGKPESVEDLVEQSRLLQTVGYKVIFESARQQKPYCSMAINWCYNEPWPTAVNNSLIGYPNEVKPAYHGVAASCRPVLVSASFDKFTWKTGEKLNIECWILNDSPEEIGKGTVQVFVTFNNKKTRVSSWQFPDLDINTNFKGPVIAFRIPPMGSDQLFEVHLEVDDRSALNSAYTLLYKN